LQALPSREGNAILLNFIGKITLCRGSSHRESFELQSGSFTLKQIFRVGKQARYMIGTGWSQSGMVLPNNGVISLCVSLSLIHPQDK